VKLLRKIADTGRTVCCTIHQPSSSVFILFVSIAPWSSFCYRHPNIFSHVLFILFCRGLQDNLLLLKKGGHSVFFGELGESSSKMIEYFERNGANPIDVGDNPANWMLRILDSGADYGDIYLKSPELKLLKKQLVKVKEDPPEELKVHFLSEFAVPTEERQRLMNKRLQTIYWRSPAYNLSRILVCVIIAFILGSVFITERQLDQLTESDARAYFAVTFLSFIIIGILCITSVLPVMLAIRDVFYKQRAAGMLDNTALGWALGTAEKGFIVLSSALFCLVFLATAGTFPNTIRRSIKFWVSWVQIGLIWPRCHSMLQVHIHEDYDLIIILQYPFLTFLRMITGLLYIQSCHLLLLRSSLHVPRSTNGDSTDLMQRLHWVEQFLFRFYCSAAVYDWPVCIHILDHTRPLRLRGSYPSSILG
jgi:ABC-2 type transporter